jgi:hypothetical protein
VFYVWLSVINLFTVSVFWQLLADVFTLEQGKRLFGFIGVGWHRGGDRGLDLRVGARRPDRDLRADGVGFGGVDRGRGDRAGAVPRGGGSGPASPARAGVEGRAVGGRAWSG